MGGFVNTAPSLANLLPDQITDEDVLFTFTIPPDTFIDPNVGRNDVLSLSVTLGDGSALPAWLNFDLATGTLSGTPTNDDVGVLDLQVTATDNFGGSDSDIFQLTVNNVNDAPVLNAPVGDVTVVVLQNLDFTLPTDTFIDVDGDDLTITATLDDGTVLPGWLTYDVDTETFSGRPLGRDRGSVAIELTADDGNGGSATTTFNVLVQSLPTPTESNIQRWETQRGAFWDEQQWFAGDFNGDGFDEMGKAFNDFGSASIDIHVSDGSSLQIERWETKNGGFWDEQQWFAGDFNGDGLDDVAKVFGEGGLASIDVHVSDGSSFEMERWETQSGSFGVTQKWLTGDFNGDGFDDVVNVFNDNGYASVDVHVSDGSSFAIQRWETQEGAFWDEQQWIVGDFNGDGLDDLAKAFDDGGGVASIDVHLSNGSSFDPVERWETRNGAFGNGNQWFAGDFNGDGLDDIGKAFNEGGFATIDIHFSTGSSVNMQRWETQRGAFWNEQQWVAGDFNGDGFADSAKAFGDFGYASVDVHVSV